MKKILFPIFIASFVFWGVVSKDACASILDLTEIKPLKALTFIPENEFNQNTEVIKEVPYDDDFLAFQVRLPKDWVESSVPLNSLNALDSLKKDDAGVAKNIFGVVTRYVSPAREYQRSTFTVEALELPHEIGAKNWFINYVLKNALSIEQIGLEKDDQVEALYVEVDGDKTYVVRVRVLINGPRMVLARYITPVEIYETGHVQQAQVLNSFKLINRNKDPVEEQKTHGFLDQSYFDYPASWRLSAPRIRSIDRMQAMAFHRSEEGKLRGQINLYLTNKNIGTSRSAVLKEYQDKFVIDGYRLGRFIETNEYARHKDMSFGITQAYEMTSNQPDLVDYELYVSVLENEGYYYVVSLLTPARDDDFYTWARNTATYQLFLKNIRLKDDSIDSYQFIEQ